MALKIHIDASARSAIAAEEKRRGPSSVLIRGESPEFWQRTARELGVTVERVLSLSGVELLRAQRVALEEAERRKRRHRVSRVDRQHLGEP